jgi:hypothetical protein
MKVLILPLLAVLMLAAYYVGRFEAAREWRMGLGWGMNVKRERNIWTAITFFVFVGICIVLAVS